MSEFGDLHDACFDNDVLAAHRFVTGTLGLRCSDPEQVAVISPEQFPEFEKRVGPTNYEGATLYGSRDIYVTSGTYNSAVSQRVDVRSRLVHEFMHSAVPCNQTQRRRHHPFFIEGFAGLGEQLYLGSRDGEEKQTLGTDDLQDMGDGLQLWLPGECAVLRGGSGERTSSNGLMAAAGLGVALKASGMCADDIFAAASRRSDKPFRLLKQATDNLFPNLTSKINWLPGNIIGIMAGTAIMQQLGRSMNLVPPANPERYPLMPRDLIPPGLRIALLP
jgi:hypothetical protein